MKLIALTGGIGAGKSFVSSLLARRGIAVYDCDAAAKRLMRESPLLRQRLMALVGNDVYDGATLCKRRLAEFILQSDENREAVNGIVHPAVADDFMQSGMGWLESAILFDSGFDKRVPFDIVVCVSAPLELRVSRIMARDNISRDQALEWIARQLPQEEVERRSDFVVTNDGTSNPDLQLEQILDKINNRN